MKAIIFAAGLGTRIQSVTKGRPKALLQIQGKSLLEHSIEYLLKHEVNSIIVNVHHQAEMVVEHLKQSKYASIISISDEKDALLDTGGGLLKAKPFFDKEDTFIAINVDVITNLDLGKMLDYHHQTKAIATLAVRERETSRYLIFDEDNTMVGWKNINSNEVVLHKVSGIQKSLAFSGVHILSSDIWKYLEQEKESKFSITPAYIKLSEEETIKAFVHNEDYWFDVGKPETYQLAENFLASNSTTS